MPSNQGAPYIMMPGSRLSIGPHGRPEESLGACCTNCASGKSCAGQPLGELGKGSLATVLVLGAAAVVGAVILYPKAWDKYMDSLWK